jgi:hypothetical protein
VKRRVNRARLAGLDDSGSNVFGIFQADLNAK